MTVDPAFIFGPTGALALSLLVLGLFYTGRILPRNTVPREDYDAVQELNAGYAERMRLLTAAVEELGKAIDKMANHK